MLTPDDAKEMGKVLQFPGSSKEGQGDRDGEKAGYSPNTIDSAGEEYGTQALREFEGDYAAALASLESAKEFVLGRELIARAERILGPRTPGPQAA